MVKGNVTKFHYKILLFITKYLFHRYSFIIIIIYYYNQKGIDIPKNLNVPFWMW